MASFCSRIQTTGFHGVIESFVDCGFGKSYTIQKGGLELETTPVTRPLFSKVLHLTALIALNIFTLIALAIRGFYRRGLTLLKASSSKEITCDSKTKEKPLNRDNKLLEVPKQPSEDSTENSIAKVGSSSTAISSRYNINQGYEGELPWESYKRKDAPQFTDTACKIHISVQRRDQSNSYANFFRAKEIVLEVANKFEIKQFKLIASGRLDYVQDGDNQDGKEFCIYFSHDEEVKIQSLIESIEARFKDEEIVTGTHSKGDMQVPRATYCYFRSPYSVFSQYLSADFLEDRGFTNWEASNISINPSFPKGWQQEINFPNEVMRLQNVESGQCDRSQAIMNQFLKDSWYNGHGFCNPLPNILVLLQGTEKPEDYPNSFVTSFFKFFKEDKNFSLGCDKLYKKVWKKSGTEKGQDLPDFFKNLLKRASIVLAAEFSLKGIEQTALPGNILPAIYHGIFVPYYKKRKVEVVEYCDFFAELPQFIVENEESIIRHIVSAGLRDRDVSQIRNSDPVLLEGTQALVL